LRLLLGLQGLHGSEGALRGLCRQCCQGWGRQRKGEGLLLQLLQLLLLLLLLLSSATQAGVVGGEHLQVVLSTVSYWF
jgi:hypothetical protein